MSDTPETDKNLWDHGDEIDPSMRPDSNGNWVPEEFARRLERERNAYRRAKQENDERFMLERDAARRERDEARNQLDALKDAVNALHDFVNEKRYDEQAISDLLNGAMKIAKDTK
jgi:hypothetical protein